MVWGGGVPHVLVPLARVRVEDHVDEDDHVEGHEGDDAHAEDHDDAEVHEADDEDDASSAKNAHYIPKHSTLSSLPQ